MLLQSQIILKSFTVFLGFVVICDVMLFQGESAIAKWVALLITALMVGAILGYITATIAVSQSIPEILKDYIPMKSDLENLIRSINSIQDDWQASFVSGCATVLFEKRRIRLSRDEIDEMRAFAAGSSRAKQAAEEIIEQLTPGRGYGWPRIN